MTVTGGPGRGRLGGMFKDTSLRASDKDRDDVATSLRLHMSEGRLTMEEFDERLDRVYASRTFGELERCMADLPRSWQILPPGKPQPYFKKGARRGWARFVWANGFCWTVWGVVEVAMGGHHLEILWPLIVSIPWGSWKVVRAIETRPPPRPELGP